MTKEMIDRINFLARKSKQEGLNDEEKAEQQELRQKYIEYIKGQVRQQLDSVKFVEEEHSCGHEHHHHHHNCSCGCGHKKH